MDRREILRYLGAATCDAPLAAMIDRAQREVRQAAAPHHVSRRFPLSLDQGGAAVGGVYFASKDLAAHLRGCQEAALTAFTLGPGVDSLIRRYELTEMPFVPVLQACAAAYTEEQADAALGELEAEAAARGLFLRPRFSPGYGDFPLAAQRLLFQALEVTKHSGVPLTDSCLMLPMKSITGVVGLSPDPSLCHVGKCMTCTAEHCPFRKEDEP